MASDTTTGVTTSGPADTKTPAKGDVKKHKEVRYKPYPTVEPRKDIINFFDDENDRQASLFIQAFTAVQYYSIKDLRSFYRIGGIHGLPYIPYGDHFPVPDDEELEEDTSRWWGYCQHGTVLFPTWHRPYVRLLEQVIRDQAIQIASDTYGKDADSKDWKTAADTLRFPYFDWASFTTKENGVPFFFTDQTLQIRHHNDKDGKKQTITVSNPLRAFTLPADLGYVVTSGDKNNPTQRPYTPPDNYSVYTPKGYSTVRYPTADYNSDKDPMNAFFKREGATNFRTGMWHVFQVPDWENFSNHTRPDKSRAISVESVHDSVHLAIGGPGGHMQDPSIAGLDPIFFFHHCNVDRMIAIWQACHPKSWLDKDYPAGDGTRTVDPAKDKLNSKTPLIPFRKENGEYFNSDEVRDLKTLGYTYPDLTGETGDGFLKKILEEYKPLVSDSARLLVNFDGITKRKRGGPFSIRLFVGEEKFLQNVTADTKWLDTPNFAGTIHIFARSKFDGCQNCQSYTQSRAALDVTEAVILSKLEMKNEITPLAKGQLKVVVVGRNGKEISAQEAGVPAPEAQVWTEGELESKEEEGGPTTTASPTTPTPTRPIKANFLSGLSRTPISLPGLRRLQKRGESWAL